ncbi:MULTISPECIES: Cys-tRNA(Pro) deacylase [unclassified Clostridioides]|uniref:Cys-tRNA(Pro) deacylase n=1 Tax=unclassified Clostridioides TaxID=2635829 RepID=UPI001D0C528C|nr:Cys-tRNA(Pro) deacylase [Clostridioides sp. ES-S-0001-02]MCC0656840.1 Cys-tRNA(Pro) deacylase [Clostridioides sp. ES-S-0123-01]MCC0673428.1 Cys-tRNA(Pro) deacylase [Clostridioides sp. ES-S-0145-01]MCC0681550.1 Cys-tRNA(Pro) deacylase [Clostridioides sp. ES-S-0005-03]MCC0696795.1 Cys-tRNA(Pro) deacylase [Clostridioides sp. ES-S-0048-02]MCC0704174.1 Cys-tRNA(Pro) deacylase [Clostridioides sp. ES-S-0049-02]MCC0706557.1 Cys-tRNA(Pro) deacylase [Clostridioides sp. ES-S-0190-01]MCC0764658.1 Cys
MIKVKTNAMRILDSNKIDYKVLSYEVKSEHVDGVEVAHDIGRDVNEVYKTLVTQGVSKSIYVYVIPVHENLDLKKAAKVAKEKSVDMIHVKDINKLTGYIRGGCSPVGMKKLYKTFVNESAKQLDTIIVSAGKIGYQIELSPLDLQKLIKVEFTDVIKK